MDQYKFKGTVRTDLYCHDCGKNFLAAINYDLNGNHIVPCPRCGHQHCRVIEDGKVTGDRWDGRHERIDVPNTSTWKLEQMSTTVASHFLRERWLNHGSD